MKGTQFHEVAAAAIPVLLLALIVEYRRAAESEPLHRYHRLVTTFSWCLQATTLTVAEIACLVQLANQPEEPYLLSDPDLLVALIAGVLFFMVVIPTIDLLKPTEKQTETKRSVLNDADEILRRAQGFRQDAEALRDKAVEAQDLPGLLKTADLLREAVEFEKQAMDSHRRSREVVSFWPRWTWRRRDRRNASPDER